MNTHAIEAQHLTASIEDGWKRYVASQERRTAFKRTHVWASSWRACDRRMVLEMAEGDRLPDWKPEQLANFRRGRDRERDILADLPRIGRDAPIPFSVVAQQERFELRDRKGRICVTGKKDAGIQFQISDRVFPVEVKSWSEGLTARIERFDDLMRSPWTRPGAYQLLCYLFGFGQPLGFLILDRHGLPGILAVELEPNLSLVEDFLTRAEQALDHLEAHTLPDYYDDPEECQRCPLFGTLCDPPLNYDPAQVISSPDLEADLVRRDELLGAAQEFERLDRGLKRKLRGIPAAIAGQFYIHGKEVTRRGYTVEASKYWETRITKVSPASTGTQRAQEVKA